MDDDRDIRGRIAELAAEERRLQGSHVGEGLTDEELSRLRTIEVDLDQCWDLLRQREAHRRAGQDPDQGALRSPGVVEGYQQ